jgi:hypothetical protein
MPGVFSPLGQSRRETDYFAETLTDGRHDQPHLNWFTSRSICPSVEPSTEGVDRSGQRVRGEVVVAGPGALLPGALLIRSVTHTGAKIALGLG